MTVADIRNGKKWIEETARRVAAEYRRSIDNLKWRTRNKGVEDGMHSFVFFVGKVRYVEIFSEDDLSDLPKTPDIKVKVERRLRGLMKPAKSDTSKQERSYCTDPPPCSGGRLGPRHLFRGLASGSGGSDGKIKRNEVLEEMEKDKE